MKEIPESIANQLKQLGQFLIRVIPKASSARVDVQLTVSGELTLKVYVTCVPEHGKANQAVRELLSDYLNYPISKILITKGEKGKNKWISLS